MTTATLTDAATVTLAFPLAAAEGLRHAITLAIHERPTSERDMLASIYGALVNPQPARAAPRPENERRDGMRGLREVAGREGARPEPVDVLAVMDRLMSAPCDACNGDCGSANPPVIGCPQREAIEARAAIAELIEVCSLTVDFAWEPGRYALYDKNDNVYGIDRYASEYEAENAREELIRAALARVGGGK